MKLQLRRGFRRRKLSLWRELHGRLLAEWRRWRPAVRGTLAILERWEVATLVLTHVPILVLDEISVALLSRGDPGFPRELLPKGPPAATVLLAPGFNQTPWTTWWMARFYATFFQYRVLFVQTPRKGNNVDMEDIVDLNRWLSGAAGGPLHAVGFSKGGLDLCWIFDAMPELEVRSIHTISSPFRGSALARLVRTTGAKVLTEGSAALSRTLEALHRLEERGVRFTFYCGFWDRVVPRSNARPPRSGGRYWAITLPQFGHTALYNPFAWTIVARRIKGSR